MLNFCSITVISNWSSECMFVTHVHCLFIVHSSLWHLRVKEMLWQELVNVQYRKPPEVVTTTAEVLDELGRKEEATQLRGWLVCQSYQVSDCFDSVIVTYPITSFLTVMSELYQKRLISEHDLHPLSRRRRYMMGHSSSHWLSSSSSPWVGPSSSSSPWLGSSSRHWLDSLVDIQSSKSADVCARTFDTLKSFSLTEVVQERQTKHTGETLTS